MTFLRAIAADVTRGGRHAPGVTVEASRSARLSKPLVRAGSRSTNRQPVQAATVPDDDARQRLAIDHPGRAEGVRQRPGEREEGEPVAGPVERRRPERTAERVEGGVGDEERAGEDEAAGGEPDEGEEDLGPFRPEAEDLDDRVAQQEEHRPGGGGVGRAEERASRERRGAPAAMSPAP